MADAGALGRPEPTDAADEPKWALTLALAGVVLTAVVVCVVALVDVAPTSTMARRRLPPPAATAAPPPRSRPSITSPPTTGPPTTAAPPTTAPTTTAVAPTAEPPSTVAPTTTAPSADRWVTATTADGTFTADFPAPPASTAPMVAGPGGSVTRVEYNVDGPAGSVISVSAVPVARNGRPVAALLDGAAAQVARDLSGTATILDRSDVSGSPARRFDVVVPGGRIRAVVVFAADRLFTVSMFEPSSVTDGSADAAFERVAASFRLV